MVSQGLRAGSLPLPAVLHACAALPLQHPAGEVMLLVEQAGDDHCLRHYEQDGEHAYTEDQLLKLVGFGSVLLHHSPDLD